jgi:peptide deformylase
MFAVYSLLAPSHPLLNERVEIVSKEEILSGGIHKEVDALIAIAESHRQDPKSGILVGLAGPQIGIAKRIIVIDDSIGRDNRDKGSLRVYLNPEILCHSETMENDQEDCYSVHHCIFGVVPRYSTIVIRASNISGQVIEEEFTGYTARIFQHEIDHLNGVRFPDKIGPHGQLHWVKEGEFSLYLHQYLDWSRDCPWDVWLAIKEGRSFVPCEER